MKLTFSTLWLDAASRIKKDRLALICFFIIAFYAIVAILAKFGFLAGAWHIQDLENSFSKPSFAHIFGTDIFGRDVFYKVIQGAKISLSVGLISSAIAIPIGVILGAMAGYFGGRVDDLIVWFYTTFASIPGILMLIALSFILGKGIFAVYVAIGLTSWVSLARIVRAEVMKQKNLEYVTACESIGGSHLRRLFIHILPNVSHLIIIDFSLRFVYAIKSEVILSFLGIGVQQGASWGIMIDDARTELLRGVWWPVLAASLAMFFICLAFNLFGDSLRDALDPNLRK